MWSSTYISILLVNLKLHWCKQAPYLEVRNDQQNYHRAIFSANYLTHRMGSVAKLELLRNTQRDWDNLIVSGNKSIYGLYENIGCSGWGVSQKRTKVTRLFDIVNNTQIGCTDIVQQLDQAEDKYKQNNYVLW